MRIDRLPHNLYRVGALLIRDKKLLLVTGGGEDTYWTPGGRTEPGESPTETLQRELREELGITLDEFGYFGTFIGHHRELPGQTLRFGYYLVNSPDEPRCAEEYITDIRWFDRHQLQGQHIATTQALREQVIVALIRGGLL